MRFGSQFGLALYDREQKHVAHSNGRRPAEPAIDTGLAQWRRVTSQRALAVRNNKLARGQVGVERLFVVCREGLQHGEVLRMFDFASGLRCLLRPLKCYCSKASARLIFIASMTQI